jgi:hypothetical protein
MTSQKKERPSSLIRAVIMSRIRVADAEAAERLADLIERFALFLIYADHNTKHAVMDLLFSVLPEDVVISLISEYVYRVRERYKRVKSAVTSIAPRISEGIEGDFLAAIIREGLQNYFQQLKAQQQLQEQPKREHVIKEVPEELKRLLYE